MPCSRPSAQTTANNALTRRSGRQLGTAHEAGQHFSQHPGDPGAAGDVAGAWNDAAGHDHVPAQLPYLIAGGLTGVILAGAGLVLFQNFEARRDSRRLEARLDAMREAIDRRAAE